MKNNLPNLDQVVAVIHACSDLITQLDTHLAGGILFVCCLLLGTIAIAHLTKPLNREYHRRNLRQQPQNRGRRQ